VAAEAEVEAVEAVEVAEVAEGVAAEEEAEAEAVEGVAAEEEEEEEEEEEMVLSPQRFAAPRAGRSRRSGDPRSSPTSPRSVLRWTARRRSPRL
jgi:hypothetical protein